MSSSRTLVVINCTASSKANTNVPLEIVQPRFHAVPLIFVFGHFFLFCTIGVSAYAIGRTIVINASTLVDIRCTASNETKDKSVIPLLLGRILDFSFWSLFTLLDHGIE